MNLEQMGKHTIQCFSHAKSHMCIFNMVRGGTCECNRTPFPSRHAAINNHFISKLPTILTSKTIVEVPGLKKCQKVFKKISLN